MLDTEAISRELVRHLRGERSQVALCRRLRYQSNVVYLWESGRRYPTPASFFLLLQRTGVDVGAGLTAFSRSATPGAEQPWTVTGAAELMRSIQRQTSASELAQALGVSRFTVGRWLRGDTEPRLPDFLQLIEVCTSRALDFLACFVDPEQLPSAVEPWRRLRAARALIAEQPWGPAVLLMLELERYRALPAHEPGWIARQLGIPLEMEARCLELLQTAGNVRLEQGRYVQVHSVSINVKRSERRWEMKRHWSEVGRQRMEPDRWGASAWTLLTVSEAHLPELLQLQRAYFRSLMDLAGRDQAMERLVLANLQLALLDDRDPDPEPEPG